MRYDAIGKRGLTSLTKCTVAMRMLAYGVATDCVDEYLKIGAITALEYMKNFALGVIEVFGDEYLRKPIQADVDRYFKLRSLGLSWYIGKYRLHALGVEELSHSLEGIISKVTL